MSAFIALDDGRSWWAANWAYDAVIEAIAEAMGQTQHERELAAWLRQQTCRECSPGLGSVDVRELSPHSRRAFRAVAQQAFRAATLAGGVGWHDPSFFPSWLVGFRRLLRMWKAVERGEPAGGLGDCPERMEPSGQQVGPGWPEGAANSGTAPDPTGE